MVQTLTFKGSFKLPSTSTSLPTKQILGPVYLTSIALFRNFFANLWFASLREGLFSYSLLLHPYWHCLMIIIWLQNNFYQQWKNSHALCSQIQQSIAEKSAKLQFLLLHSYRVLQYEPV